MKIITSSHYVLVVLICGGVCATVARAEVVTTYNYSQWQSSVRDYATIDFTGFPSGTPISNQYGNSGLVFSGPTFISGPTPAYPNDGWGLHGAVGVHIFFDEPQLWMAIHHAGNAYFKLYAEGQLVGTSIYSPFGGIGSFHGVLSSVWFDEVIITLPPIDGTHIFIDDLHWGAPVPGPGMLMIASLLGAMGHKRRGR